MATLQERLDDWTDIDVAQHLLAQSLGVVPADWSMAMAKSVYWTSNPLGDTLSRMLDQLVDIGVLEKRGEPDWQYRWSKDYKGITGGEPRQRIGFSNSS